MTDSTLKTTITTVAGQPKSASGDSIAVTQHGLLELKETDQYLTAQNAVQREHRGLYLGKIRNPSAV